MNRFPIQILLPKFKEERTEVISRLLSNFLHTNYKNIWTFLNFFNTFSYLFHDYDVTSLWNIHSITFWKDQVYSNTRVSTRVNANQHKSTQINKSPTRINTSQYESNTNQHESDTNQHESTRVRHESTRVNTSPKQVNNSKKVKKSSRRVSASQLKSDISLTWI